MKSILKAIFGIGVPAIILVYTVTYCYRSLLTPYVIPLMVILIAAYTACLFTTAAWKSKVQTTVYIFSLTYLLGECTCVCLLSANLLRKDLQFFYRGLTASNKPLMVYDTICGYRALSGHKRYLYIINGTAEIDHIITANSEGWYSERPYTYRKKNSRIKRYMVLGDSFSSGLVLPTAWPDIVQQQLIANGNDSVELYNFSVDGSGIQNWYRIFFKELVPRYDFDGIIIAVSAEKDGVPDFDRKLIIGQSKADFTFMAATDITAQAPAASFPYSDAVPLAAIYNDEKLDEIKAGYTNSGQRPFHFQPVTADLHFLNIFLGVTDGIYKALKFSKNFAAYTKPYETYYALADKPYQMKYFDDRYQYGFLLKEIIAHCQQHNKNLIFAGIPDYESAQDFINAKPCIYRNELKFMAAHYHCPYFDGYSILQNNNIAFVDSVFYFYDRHWNERGAILFAGHLAQSGLLQ
jgi:hypothetical protein